MLARRICSSVVLPLLLAVSCVEKIVLDPMEEMPVVVNCVLMTERTTQELDLYYAKRPSETAYVPITDAKVVVRDASGNSYPFHWNGERWTSDFVPVYKTRYFLHRVKDNLLDAGNGQKQWQNHTRTDTTRQHRTV